MAFNKSLVFHVEKHIKIICRQITVFARCIFDKTEYLHVIFVSTVFTLNNPIPYLS